MTNNIAKRIYAPISKDSDRPGFYMVERYTLTAQVADQTTGTRIGKRDPNQQIVRIDLTPENYDAPDGASRQEPKDNVS